jgi:hypothetical protein
VDGPFARRRFLAPAATGTFWAAEPTRLELQLWSASGTLHRVISRSSRAFPPRDPAAETALRRRSAPPPPLVAGISTDSANPRLVWILLSVPGARWHPVERAGARAGGRIPIVGWTERDELFDSVIECIDTVTGRLLAAARFPNFFTGFAGQGILTDLVEDASGALFLRTFRLSLNVS